MNLQERIEKDINALAKKKTAGMKLLVQNLKYIKSEWQLLLGKRTDKVATDEEILGIIKVFIKNEELNATKTGKSSPDMDYVLGWIQGYFPKSDKIRLTDEDIVAWIHQNIDFSTVPNKMAAMKPIMAGLSEYDVDGKNVKALLEKM